MPGRRFIRPAAAAVSGVLLVLIFPLPELSFLAWIAIVPLIAASVNSPPREAFKLGYIAGAIWTAGALYWTRVYHPAALLLIVLILAAYTGLFALSVNVITRKMGKEALLFTAPAAWTAVEYLKTLGFLGFPWNSLGYSQYRNLPLIQISEYTGVFGISFLIAAVNGGAAAAFFLRKRPGRAAAALLLSILLPLTVFQAGRRTAARYEGTSQEKHLKINVIQPSIHPEISWSEYGHIITESLVKLNLEAADEKPFLTIFPETVISEDLSEAFKNKCAIYAAFRRMAEDSGGYILTGAHRRNEELFNSAYLISPAGEIIQRYDKMKLVPGGEYLPFLRDNKTLNKITRGAGGYTPGKNRTIFSADGEKFAALICFEGIFGNHTRKFVRDGARFLVNITNDAWSMSRTSHLQHASMAVFRSIENRIYLVRAGNTGISKVINPAGRTEKEIEYWQRGYFTHQITPGPAAKTFYTRRGDVFSIIIIIIFFIMSGSAAKTFLKRDNEKAFRQDKT